MCTFTDSNSVHDCFLFMKKSMKVVEYVIAGYVWSCVETLPKVKQNLNDNSCRSWKRPWLWLN